MKHVPDPTVADVIRLYLEEREVYRLAGAYKPDSLRRDQFYLGSFAARFGAQLVTDCRRHDLALWLGEHPDWKSSHTKADAAAIVVRCFRWAAEEELIDRAPY